MTVSIRVKEQKARQTQEVAEGLLALNHQITASEVRCYRCGSRYVCASNSADTLDWLYRIANRNPIRCYSCGARFYSRLEEPVTEATAEEVGG